MGKSTRADGGTERQEVTSKGPRKRVELGPNAARDFEFATHDIMEVIHSTAREKGFWDKPRNVGEMLCLIHSEVSEALEAHRKSDEENFVEELADTVIRIFDLACAMELPLPGAILEKMEKNSKRERLHGKNY